MIPNPLELPLAPRLRRGFWIELTDLLVHGYTSLCPKCDAIRAGRQVGTGHPPESAAGSEPYWKMHEMVTLNVQRRAGQEMRKWQPQNRMPRKGPRSSPWRRLRPQHLRQRRHSHYQRHSHQLLI